MTDTDRASAKETASSLLAAPHGTRLAAFVVDLVVVGGVALLFDGGWPLWLAAFVAYHAGLVWATGQTLGKAVANLEVRRVDGAVYQHTRWGLAWAVGRASVGYLGVDLLGRAARRPRPRKSGPAVPA